MKHTKTQKFIIIAGYAVSLIVFSYLCSLTVNIIKDINNYIADGGMVTFWDGLSYTLSNIILLAVAMTLAFATNIYSRMAGKKTDTKAEPAEVRVPNIFNENEMLVVDTQTGKVKEKGAIAESVQKTYENQEKAEEKSAHKAITKPKAGPKTKSAPQSKAAPKPKKMPQTKDVPKHSKMMTLQEAANKLDVSKDRVYRYCKSSGICDNHKDESPIMIDESEFKKVKAHFLAK